MITLKIPVNVSTLRILMYHDMFAYLHDHHVQASPYLSCSKFSIRAGQDYPEHAKSYIYDFLSEVPSFMLDRIQLVYNARVDSHEMRSDILIGLAELQNRCDAQRDIALVITVPQLAMLLKQRGYYVIGSSASILSYKALITYLAMGIESELSEYVIPSTYNHVLSHLNPSNKFGILLNNGCKLNCINAATIVDHSSECPIQSKSYYTTSRALTDLVTRKRFQELVALGWTNFKIAGRQADPNEIFDTIKYYLDPEYKNSTELPPYIDNHIWYGESSNG